jgi:hypothetical protein
LNDVEEFMSWTSKLHFCLPCFIILALVLASCSSGSPLSIAAAPRPAGAAADRDSRSLRLVLEVAEVTGAADSAAALTQRYNGRVVEWDCQGAVIFLTLAAPQTRIERLQQALLGLGQVLAQGEWVNAACTRCANEAFIHLELRPLPTFYLDLQPPLRQDDGGDWNPLWTFRRAWKVFTRIFAFLADGLIWLVVVAGPFIMLGLGVWALEKRRKA